MTRSAVARLRAHAIGHSLFPPTGLAEAVERLGFVQADPIRSPAPAQDLILRHRVDGYRVDDLDRAYSGLELDEGVLYAYGFMPRRAWRWMYPPDAALLPAFDAQVYAAVVEMERTHPRDLDDPFGRMRARNDWGGYSQASKLALERLHRRGLLRIARRDKGVRVYEPAPPPRDLPPPAERLRRLALLVAHVSAPASRRSLQATLAPIGGKLMGRGAGRRVLEALLAGGELEEESLDGVAYVWPPATRAEDEAPPCVRLLAPFDPLVRDRERFEQLWGWRYRFEAYTPAHIRRLGYYAMPLLWRDRVIGWANAKIEAGRLDVETGCIGEAPREAAFRRALDAEVASLESFLGVDEGGARERRRRPRAATPLGERGGR